MLSRRDKLLVQPWEDRRFQDHRAKVKSALPAIDSRAPAARPHVALKLKQCQRELERTRGIQRDNHSLLQRLAAVMRARRLDNRWEKPLPDFHHKVGLFFDAQSLHSKLSARSLEARSLEAPDDTYSNVKCYACDIKKKKYELNLKLYGTASHRDSLPSIYSGSTV